MQRFRFFTVCIDEFEAVVVNEQAAMPYESFRFDKAALLAVNRENAVLHKGLASLFQGVLCTSFLVFFAELSHLHHKR